MRTALPEALYNILAKHISAERRFMIKPETMIEDDLRFDDLHRMSIAQDCDERWLIEIPDREWRAWRSLSDIASTIEQMMGIPV